MDTNDTISQLIAEKKYDELRSYIATEVQKKYSSAERGQALLGLATLYIDITNAINSRHQSTLEDIAKRVNKINQTEMEVNDDIDLKIVRSKLV